MTQNLTNTMKKANQAHFKNIQQPKQIFKTLSEPLLVSSLIAPVIRYNQNNTLV